MILISPLLRINIVVVVDITFEYCYFRSRDDFSSQAAAASCSSPRTGHTWWRQKESIITIWPKGGSVNRQRDIPCSWYVSQYNQTVCVLKIFSQICSTCSPSNVEPISNGQDTEKFILAQLCPFFNFKTNCRKVERTVL